MSALEEPNGVPELSMLLKFAVNINAVLFAVFAQIFQTNITCEVLDVHSVVI